MRGSRLALPRDPAALAAGLLRLLERAAREPDLGERARRRIVAEFGLERLVERTEAALGAGLPARAGRF